MNQQITGHCEHIGKTHETQRRLAAYVVFGLNMGFLFGTLVHSLFVGVLLGVPIASLAVIRPDFHRPATIYRESARTEGADTREPDIWRSAIILPTRYAADATCASVKRRCATGRRVTSWESRHGEFRRPFRIWSDGPRAEAPQRTEACFC